MIFDTDKGTTMQDYMTSRELLEHAETLYTFVDMFSGYENVPRDYGTGQLFSMTEVHLLNAIYSNPGITSTELGKRIRRTKGFVSQTVSKLEKLGYVIRVASDGNARRKALYVTAAGQKLCIAHNEFDEVTLLKTYHYLLRDCTPTEIVNFYKVLQTYINIMDAAAAKRKRAADSAKAEAQG